MTEALNIKAGDQVHIPEADGVVKAIGADGVPWTVKMVATENDEAVCYCDIKGTTGMFRMQRFLCSQVTP